MENTITIICKEKDPVTGRAFMESKLITYEHYDQLRVPCTAMLGFVEQMRNDIRRHRQRTTEPPPAAAQ